MGSSYENFAPMKITGYTVYKNWFRIALSNLPVCIIIISYIARDTIDRTDDATSTRTTKQPVEATTAKREVDGRGLLTKRKDMKELAKNALGPRKLLSIQGRF